MKKIILTAAILLILGLAITAIALALGGSFDTVQYSEVTHEIDRDFDHIALSTSSANVIIKRSDSDKCYAVCSENDKITYTVTVDDGTLTVKENDSRRWWNLIQISFQSARVTLYLPKEAYTSLSVNTGAGGILCHEKELSFDRANLSSAGGAIDLSAPIKSELVAKASSGRIKLVGSTLNSITVFASSGGVVLEDMAATGLLKATTSSGGIRVKNCNAAELSVEVTSGGVALENVTATELFTVVASSGGIRLKNCNAAELSVEVTSGGVTLENVTATGLFAVVASSGGIHLQDCDAAELYLKSSSGGVRATLRSGKQFEVTSSNGQVDCPPSTAGAGKCTVVTSSGNINIKISE